MSYKSECEMKSSLKVGMCQEIGNEPNVVQWTHDHFVIELLPNHVLLDPTQTRSPCFLFFLTPTSPAIAVWRNYLPRPCMSLTGPWGPGTCSALYVLHQELHGPCIQLNLLPEPTLICEEGEVPLLVPFKLSIKVLVQMLPPWDLLPNGGPEGVCLLGWWQWGCHNPFPTLGPI